jgi:hypothetical protein
MAGRDHESASFGTRDEIVLHIDLPVDAESFTAELEGRTIVVRIPRTHRRAHEAWRIHADAAPS